MFDLLDPLSLVDSLPTGLEVGSVAAQIADLIVWLSAAVVPSVLLWSARRQPSAVGRLHILIAVFAAGTGLAPVLRTLPTTQSGSSSGALAAVIAGVIGLWAGVTLLRRLRLTVRVVERKAGGDNPKRSSLLETAVNASSDGVMIVEATTAVQPNPRIVYANPAFEHIMGYSIEEAVGLSPSVFCRPEGQDLGLPSAEQDDATEAVEAVRAAMQGTDPVRLELPSRRKDGVRVWAEWQIVPVCEHSVGSTHWVAVIRDTTERRRLEERLLESQKMDAVGRLAGGIAHDFNNLLTVIQGNAELLRDPTPGATLDPELLDEIRGAAERATGLVRQLLTFGRRQSTRPVVLDLNVVVVEMAGMLRRLLGERVSVTTTLSSEPIRVRIDRGQVEQVMMNLAVNARDAMPWGGILTITTATVVDTLQDSWSPVRFARLTVKDNGTGMIAAVRAKIFEPFFTTKGPGQGTGLGLATVYGIVTQAGGRIGVDSAPGLGTTFSMDLPWCSDPAGSSAAILPIVISAPDRGCGRGRSVLLVEDEDGVRRFARSALVGSGYAVCDAPDAETALNQLESLPMIDLLVTDLTMPGMGGRELALRVRAERPEVAVVFISGYAADINQLDSVPANVFLAKPFAPDDLLRMARKALALAALPTSASA